MHLEAGFDNPLQNWLMQSVLKGIKRLNGVPAKKKLPITIEIMCAIHSKLDMHSAENRAFWAAATVGFFSFLRKASLLPRSSEGGYKCVLRKDIKCIQGGAVLTVRHTKTIQNQERTLSIPLPRIMGSPLCPVSSVEQMLMDAKEVSLELPLFTFLINNKAVLLTHAMFVKQLKLVLAQCGLDTAKYSGHSFRRGGATFAFSCNVPPLLIKLQGDWRSEAYQGYITIPVSKRWDMMRSLARVAQSISSTN
jgi:hypothetical protein